MSVVHFWPPMSDRIRPSRIGTLLIRASAFGSCGNCAAKLRETGANQIDEAAIFATYEGLARSWGARPGRRDRMGRACTRAPPGGCKRGLAG
jgi:hypothetical protein